MDEENQPLKLNVGGMIFETLLDTLVKVPSSKLSRILTGSEPSIQQIGPREYFIDRDGSLFGYILDFLRTSELLLPGDFRDYDSLAKEFEFYELDPMLCTLETVQRKNKSEILEVRYIRKRTGAFFRVFGSSVETVLALSSQITLHVEKANFSPQASSEKKKPITAQILSFHDLVFQCGAKPYVNGGQVNIYVQVASEDRKILLGFNVLGILLDYLTKIGFYLQNTRAIHQQEDTVDCYTFKRNMK
ncbi:putative potassium channel regulatory protein [Scyliorhinus canicula]|uniref:putative potassium channel regulatory protein n=1 Tax=Scyliorhinus canicula TaxID=7830 RepID=UPI0018F44986|nr:putative potassium channel regulatory protein [Scyliorhinus canicula]